MMAWSSMTPRDRGALGRIVECLDAIDAYTTRVGPGWPDDGMAVDAIAKRIEEIGEVAKRIDVATLAHMAEIDWRALRGFVRSSSMTTTRSISKSSLESFMTTCPRYGRQ